MKKIFKIITKICGGLVALILVVMIVTIVLPLIPPFHGYFHSRTVLTGSMSPVIPTGALIINRYSKDRDLEVGDIITFQKPNTVTPIFITHRIINIDKSGLLYHFQTKGDANTIPEIETITQANMEGKVIAIIPYLGYLIDILKTPIAFAILVFIPLCIFIFRQLSDAWKIWKKRSEEKNKKDDNDIGPKIVVLIAIFLISQTTVAQTVYASFRSSPVQIQNIILATKSNFGCIKKDGDKHSDKNCQKEPKESEDCDNDHHPKIGFTRSSDRKSISFKIKCIFHYKHLSYEVVYDSKDTQNGVIGKHDLSGEDEFSKDVQLGSCSEKDCIYQTNPRNFRLNVKLDDSDGNEIEINAQED